MKKISILDGICVVITTLFGLGFTPFFGGTLASIAAVVIFLIVKSKIYFTIIFILATILSFLFCSRAEKIFDEKDCKKIIIDDFCGMSLALLFIPYDIRFVTAAFIL
ncbi:MAG: phosphatidylglycerophosphatase A, partial [Candidatus Omnitrophota bacterium]